MKEAAPVTQDRLTVLQKAPLSYKFQLDVLERDFCGRSFLSLLLTLRAVRRSRG